MSFNVPRQPKDLVGLFLVLLYFTVMIGSMTIALLSFYLAVTL